MNVDATVNDLEKKCATGAVLKDQNGKTRGCFQVGLGFFSPLFAEL